MSATLGLSFEERLSARFGSRASVLPHVRRLYGYDATGVVGVPVAVLFPESVRDVADAVALAREFGLPVVGRGSGTGLSAGAVPEHGGILMTFEHMRRVSAVDLPGRSIWAEPGVVNQSLETHLAPLGYFYAPDPASHRASSIGGNLAENAGGPHAVKYGVTGFHVRQLEVVDALGNAGIFTAGELQPSLDLVSLVVGSEGTLALITRARVGIEEIPERVVTLLVSFESMARATDFVSAVVAAGIVPACLEFMDRNTIRLIEAWGVTHYSEGAEAVLLLDVDGSQAEVDETVRGIRRLAGAGGALEMTVAEDDVQREALWLGRRGAYAVLARDHPRTLIQDVTVPRSKLTAMIDRVQEIATRYGLKTATVGHAGDGNLHPDFPYDPADAEMTERVHAANREVLEACVALDGSITGEHGIGSDKIHSLPAMYGPVDLGLMAEVKRALDPENILNPGKAVPLVPRDLPAAAGAPHPYPKTAEEVREAVLAARSQRRPLRIDLAGLRGISIAEEDLVIEVGSGESFAAVEAALEATSLQLPVSALRETNLTRALLFNDYGVDHLRAGLFRHALLAVTYVTGAGEPARMGRPVVKNVAGYDLFRLLIGSRGRLAVPVSFIFRLVPRSNAGWVVRDLPASALPQLLAGPRQRALFALPMGDALRVYARTSVDLEGWAPAPEAGEVLNRVSNRLRRTDSLLDLALPPAHLEEALAALPGAPEIVLPAASRVVLHLSRDEAESLAHSIRDRFSGPIRATYGPAWEELLPPEPLAAAWEERLIDVFDPDRVLSDWLVAS